MVLMKTSVLLPVLLLLIFSGPVRAEDYDKAQDVPDFEEFDFGEEEHMYQFPDIRPEASIYSGYRFVDKDGSERVFEYEYLDDYFEISGDLRIFEYPHRLHIESDFNNPEDYYGDLRYAYTDRVLFRWLNTTVTHNLTNIELSDPDSSTSSPGISVSDQGIEYGTGTGINRIDLRLKKHNFPLHAYANVMHVRREGERQQRSLTGSGSYNNILRTTQSRDIKQDTKTYIIGTNSHLGPLEADLRHTEKRFNDRGDEVLYDSYSSSSSRSAGAFPHNEIPELKGSSNSIRFHTSYTGKLVASAGFKVKERENTLSGATQDIFTGTGSLRWMPLTTLSFFLNYSHRDIDAESAASVSMLDISSPSNRYTYQVKPPLSSTTDNISLTGRYRPVSKVTLRTKYSCMHIERENAGLWNLEDSTTRNTLSFSADTRIVRGLEIKTNYTHHDIRNPSYNTEPDDSDRGMVSVSWLPRQGINLLASYSVTKDSRDDLDYTETQDAYSRDLRSDTVFGSGTFQILKDLSLTAGYAYMRYKIRQDIVYALTSGAELSDKDVPLDDKAHVYSISLDYIPIDNLILLTQVSHTRTSGEFRPDSPDLTSPVSVSSYSQFETTETVYEVAGRYDFSNGFSGGIETRYSDFDDVLDNIHDNEKDGDAMLVLLTVSKKWK